MENSRQFIRNYSLTVYFGTRRHRMRFEGTCLAWSQYESRPASRWRRRYLEPAGRMLRLAKDNSISDLEKFQFNLNSQRVTPKLVWTRNFRESVQSPKSFSNLPKFSWQLQRPQKDSRSCPASRTTVVDHSSLEEIKEDREKETELEVEQSVSSFL